MSVCRAAIEAGAGIALLPVASLHAAVKAGRLEVVLPGWFQGDTPLFAVLPSGQYVPARVTLLRDFLVATLGKQLAETNQACARAKAKLHDHRPPSPVRR